MIGMAKQMQMTTESVNQHVSKEVTAENHVYRHGYRHPILWIKSVFYQHMHLSEILSIETV
jgi:hypothetical protein